MIRKTLLSLGMMSALALPAGAQDKAAVVDQGKIDDMIKVMFAKTPADWQARTVLDETQRMCTNARSQVSAKEADAIQAREMKTVVFPADGKLLGQWKEGFKVANNGRGWQFSDAPDVVPGGNCYACHQMDPKELSYGTLGPSLAGYGKDRKYDAESIRAAYTKIYNAQAVVACSNMPRFGSMKALTEQQIKDVVAYLFDPESPVNK